MIRKPYLLLEHQRATHREKEEDWWQYAGKGEYDLFMTVPPEPTDPEALAALPRVRLKARMAVVGR
ncbi:hypothetical protein Q5752_003296 [Cryptotrichosporon argae]